MKNFLEEYNVCGQFDPIFNTNNLIGLPNMQKAIMGFTPPKLKKCSPGENPGLEKENCCLASEYNTFIFHKFLDKKGYFDDINLNGNNIFYKFLKSSPEIKEKIIEQIISYENKEFSIPVGQPLSTEQMGLLEATIFGTFVIVKSLFKL